MSKTNGYNEKMVLLKKMCQDVKKNAYCPYSNFPIGCAVLTDQGNIFTGTNVENCSYGLTLCGEIVAISSAISAGERKILAIAVSTDLPPETTTSLCGRCRQFLAEFGGPETEIVIINCDGSSHTETLGQLLPNAFTPKSILL